MASGYLETLSNRQLNQYPSVVEAEREWLLYVHVVASFQAFFGNCKVALWGRTHVNDVRLRLAEHLRQIAKICFDWESLGDLPRHEQLPIAYSDNFTAFNPLNLRAMVIS